jgi:cytochrome c oxidase subunit II
VGPGAPLHDLSFRSIRPANGIPVDYTLMEYPMAAIVAGAAKAVPEPSGTSAPPIESTAAAGAPATAETGPAPQIFEIKAKKFEYSPREITVKVGVPVVLKLTSLDRLHGFNCPGLKLRADIEPGKTSEVRFTATKVGTYPFFCDIYCGGGHGGMNGRIIVTG